MSQFWKFPLKVQTWSSAANDWFDTVFQTKSEFTAYMWNQFKPEPHYYKLRNTKKWKETGQYYADTVTKPNFEGGRYHNFVRDSAKYTKWKEIEKDRIKNGVIYDGVYIPPFYYWYLNFCPIFNDIELRKQFADVWDGDLWYMHYVMLCILNGKHIGGVKGRQKGYSFKHMAILYWCYCWFEQSVNTVGAYREDLVAKSWRYLEGYRSHINANTPWKRGPKQPKALMWIETQPDENEIPRGLNSKLAGVTFKQSPFNDVGGPQTFFNYEEPGVSPTILMTLEAQRPALEKGSITAGYIIACGSVGELDDAEGIKSIFYDPKSYNFLPLKNIWDDDAAEDDVCCIFISEAYNLIGEDVTVIDPKDDPFINDYTGKPFMDEDGNSDVELAKKWILRQKELQKKSKKTAELKQVANSQKCISPKEAFAERKVSEWPLVKLRAQQERIKLKEEKNLWEFKPLKGLMEEKDGKPYFNQKPAGGLPIEHAWPIKADWEDKRGVCTMYEPPITENPKMFTYFASVDAVEVEVTETSQSVASLDIFRRAQKVRYKDKDGKIQTRIEGDKLVFTYRGRFSDAPDSTNEQMWLGIKLYNAFVYPERNKPNFINYMKKNGRSHYMATEGDVPIMKDMNIKNGNGINNSKIGFHKGDNTDIWKHFKSTAKEYFFTEYGRNSYTKSDGTEKDLKIFTGIDRIDDYWLLEEFCQHVEGLNKNYDRLISFMGALFICKVYEQNLPMPLVDEVKEDKNEKVVTKAREISMIGSNRISKPFNPKRDRPRYMI